MRVLFIPYQGGPISHGIPLLALKKRLRDASIQTAFLAPRPFHDELRRFGAELLDIDYSGFRTEMMAYGEFAPDVVVDDMSITTGYACALSGVPRVTVQRTGIFAGATPRNANHQHSLGLNIAQLPDVTFLSLPQPRTLSDLFRADIKIIPGIRLIEVLPAHLQNDPSYFYSGPLFLDDLLVVSKRPSGAEGSDPKQFESFKSLEAFFDANKDRRIVYVTVGTVASATKELLDCLKYLVSQGVAVVSSISLPGLSPAEQALYYHAMYLPLNFVCSKVDLAIHHCGSGTYHYPILHNLPSITVGTKCYDRDDVAVRLQELGGAIHLGATDEREDFFADFKDSIDRYFESAGVLRREMQKRLAALNKEVRETAEAFDFEALLHKATAHSKKARQSV
jgi:UDP:flavonoid glycosyltransferase YjiC (YdhE family)